MTGCAFTSEADDVLREAGMGIDCVSLGCHATHFWHNTSTTFKIVRQETCVVPF